MYSYIVLVYHFKNLSYFNLGNVLEFNHLKPITLHSIPCLHTSVQPCHYVLRCPALKYVHSAASLRYLHIKSYRLVLLIVFVICKNNLYNATNTHNEATTASTGNVNQYHHPCFALLTSTIYHPPFNLDLYVP